MDLSRQPQQQLCHLRSVRSSAKMIWYVIILIIKQALGGRHVIFMVTKPPEVTAIRYLI